MTPGKKQRGTMPGMPKAPTLASDRLALLIEQMKRDIGPVRGRNAKIAKLLGIDRSSITRVPTSDRGISLQTIERIRTRIRLKPDLPDFFSEARLGKTPHYRDFLAADSPIWDALPAGLRTSKPTATTTAPGLELVPPVEATDFETMLAALGATDRERAAWAHYTAMFPLPYYNAGHVATFIGGLRMQLALHEAIDRAVSQSAESEMRATGRRKVDKNPE